jgi:hypothetical protein
MINVLILTAIRLNTPMRSMLYDASLVFIGDYILSRLWYYQETPILQDDIPSLSNYCNCSYSKSRQGLYEVPRGI